jgi:transposase
VVLRARRPRLGWPGHPAAAYIYSEDRKSERPAGHLAGFRGVLHGRWLCRVQAVAGDRTDGSVTLAFCWAHMRRPFYEFFTSTKSPLAAEVLTRIRELYAIEAEIRGHHAKYRRTIRQERSRPIVDALHAWLHDQAGRVSAASDWPRLFAMRSGIGPALWCSLMTAGSRWTRTWSSVPSPERADAQERLVCRV